MDSTLVGQGGVVDDDISVLGWGFIGAGSISDDVAAQAISEKVVDPVAVYARRHEQAAAFADRHGFRAVYSTIDELLADASVEAVYIALPHSLHVDATIRALRAGKHVLCEKPFALNAAEVRQGIAASNDRVVAEAFMIRHHPQWQWIEQRIEDGSLGAIRHVLWSMSLDFPEPVQPPTLPGQGSILLDVASYGVNIARMAFGSEPSSISANTVDLPSGVDVRVSAQLQFGDGTAQIMVDARAPRISTVRIMGSNGYIDVLSPVHADADGIARLSYRFGDSEASDIDFVRAPQYALQLKDFARCVALGERPAVDLTDALGNAECLDAIRLSASRNGQLVTV